MTGMELFQSILGTAGVRCSLEIRRSPARRRGGAVLAMSRRESDFILEVEIDAQWFDIAAPQFEACVWQPEGEGDIHAQFVCWAEAADGRTQLLMTHMPAVVTSWWGEERRGTGGWHVAHRLVFRNTVVQRVLDAEQVEPNLVEYRVRIGRHTLLLPFDGTEPTIILDRERLVDTRPRGITLVEAARLTDDLDRLRNLVAYSHDALVCRRSVMLDA